MPGLRLIARTGTEIRRDVAAVKARDPAAQGVATRQILAAWPGVHALLAHRVAHALYGAGATGLARLIAAVARSITGIEIHPAARIGDGFFVDHGMGVVVGETAEIGDNVTLYQGVTLGGTGFATGKRHPTVQDNVTIGSGAKLLGPIIVGHGAKIGANSVVIHDVPPNATVVGNPGHPVRVEGRRPEGPDADWIHLPDPVAEAIKGLASRIAALEADTTVAPPANGGLRRPNRPADGDGGEGAAQPDGRANPSVGPNPAGG
jgi:serine O-acetyltransferase